MRLQRATGKGRIFHDDLHAFSSGGILFVNNGALRKERVSDGILFANSSKKYEKMPPETDGFWTSFTFKRLACYGTVKGIDSATDPLPLPLRRRKYYVYRWGDPFPTVEQHVPSNSQCSGSVSRNTSIPCFGRT